MMVIVVSKDPAVPIQPPFRLSEYFDGKPVKKALAFKMYSMFLTRDNAVYECGGASKFPFSYANKRTIH